jgi:Domain of unknown function (DUF222)
MSPMERLARLHGLLDEIHAETVSFATVENAAVYAGLVEQAARKIDALAIGVLDSVGQSGVHKDDGFSTAQSWNAYVCRTTRGETIRRAGLARMFRDLPQTGDAYRAGQIGREQLSTLLNTYRIERCRTQLGESLDMLMGDERRLTAAEFANVMKHWTRLADADGARQKHQTTHEFRDLRIFENFDGGFTLQGSFGALQGATIRELFDRFVQAERLADWDEAREINGDETNSSHLARTEAQRRADAFEAALLQASATLPDANLPEPSVNHRMRSSTASPPSPTLRPSRSTRRTIATSAAKPSVALSSILPMRSPPRSKDICVGLCTPHRKRRSLRKAGSSPVGSDNS